MVKLKVADVAGEEILKKTTAVVKLLSNSVSFRVVTATFRNRSCDGTKAFATLCRYESKRFELEGAA